MLQYVLFFIASVVSGYAFFRLLLFYVPRRMSLSERSRCREIIAESRRQAVAVKNRQHQRGEEELAYLRSETEESLRGQMDDLQVVESDLDAQEEHLQREESRVALLAKQLDNGTARVETSKTRYETAHASWQQDLQQLQHALQERCGERAEQLHAQSVVQIVESRTVECQKILKAIVFDHNSGAKRIAQRFLGRVHSRYSPEFIWPRSLNSVEVKDRRKFELLHNDDKLLRELEEVAAGVQVKLLDNERVRVVKLTGGFGLSREAVRLTLNEVLALSPGSWGRAQQAYYRHYMRLEQEALKLGRKACRELQLDGIHAEIQKLVGSLNWRTSYKQNQWYHSVEVAKLAGLLGHELGVDPAQARRCGLLHDIGKAIDYRIEGSHAVISGDYADRYGEERMICDVVMSHHNDLLVETPLAWVLKSADTLSGARPGARVNIEEDYQSRLYAIEDLITSFRGVSKVMIMNGAREIHVDVDQSKVKEAELADLSRRIAAQLSAELTFPGQIKIILSRRFEATLVA